VFDIGLGELAIIAFVAVLVFGPDKLPELARQAGRFLHKAKTFANSARDELRTELGPAYSDLELRDLDPRTIVRKHVIEAMEDAEAEEASTQRRGLRPLAAGEVPPYDVEAT
jgi:sec-independent protein translocase protein TatB